MASPARCRLRATRSSWRSTPRSSSRRPRPRLRNKGESLRLRRSMARTSADDTTKLWEGLTRAHNLMTAALEKDLVPQAGMAQAWYEVLHHLTQAPGGLLRYQELAKVSGITDSGASRRL